MLDSHIVGPRPFFNIISYLSGACSYSDESRAGVGDDLTNVREIHVDKARPNNQLRRADDLPRISFQRGSTENRILCGDSQSYSHHLLFVEQSTATASYSKRGIFNSVSRNTGCAQAVECVIKRGSIH